MDHLKLENRHNGEILRLRRVRDPSGQTVLAIDGSSPPRSSGPPPHVHVLQSEDFVVKGGSLGVRIGTETAVIPTGGAAAFPAGALHSWWNAGEDLVEMSGQATPAVDLDRFFQGLFAVLNASSTGRPSIFYLAHVLWRHRDTQRTMVPPQLVQRILFPLILLVGRILGKYHGADWPGSPESCLGAPLTDIPPG